MDIIGHSKITNLLNRSITRGIVNQAYLFSGPEHLGKFTVALDFAGRLSGGDAETNPDLIIVRPEATDKKGMSKIKIEQIRDLAHKLSLMAASGKYKVAIIDEADCLNKAAQNALLKTLEEPNEKIVLILVSQDNKKLLSTLKSRCQRVKFSPVSCEDLEKNIPASEKNREAIIFWSLGRPGLMLELIKDRNALDFRVQAAAELKMLFSKNLAEKFALAEALAKDSHEAARKLNLWAIILRENLLGRGSFREGQKKCFEIIENIEKSLERMKETNSSTRLILENLFLHF